jgi:hypothetical protein
MTEYGTIEVPMSTVIGAMQELAAAVTDFIDDAANGPWRPETDVTEEGLRRQRDTIWLTNDDGDSLQIDEDTAAMLVEALRLTHLGLAAAGETRPPLHETHHCRDCDAEITLPYVRPDPLASELVSG